MWHTLHRCIERNKKKNLVRHAAPICIYIYNIYICMYVYIYNTYMHVCMYIYMRYIKKSGQTCGAYMYVYIYMRYIYYYIWILILYYMSSYYICVLIPLHASKRDEDACECQALLLYVLILYIYVLGGYVLHIYTLLKRVQGHVMRHKWWVGLHGEKIQEKKRNTRASMRAQALDVKAHVEVVPEVQLTVVCWS